jgi:hypothetical protein
MKTKSIMLILIALMGLIGFNSCEKIKGKGETVKESRVLDGYSGIDLAIDGIVYYTQGPGNNLTVEAQENLLPYIQTIIDNNRLILREKPGVILGKHEPIIFRITSPSVSAVEISGSGIFYVQGTWTGDNLEAKISGSGSISISSVDTRTFQAYISGSGNMITSAGIADSENLRISGSGSIDLRQTIAKNTTANISGSGDIYTNVSDQLDALIAGSGSVYYLGQPVINTQISGSGKVIRL